MVQEIINMYQITKELIMEEDGVGEVEPAIIKSENPNNCKFFKKVVNAVGIDEDIFKSNNSYKFKVGSKEAIKSILCKHKEYGKLMKQHPKERDFKILDELTTCITWILKNEIEEAPILNSNLAKVELITFNQRQKLNQYLQKLVLPDFEEMINASDNEIIQLYYIEEMMKLRKKVERIRGIFSEIRTEEIVNLSLEEVKNTDVAALENELYPEKIYLDKLIIKNLIDPKQSKSEIVQDTLQDLSDKLNMPVKKVVAALKQFRKSGYEDNEYFELSMERDYANAKGLIPAYDVLQNAIEEYDENLKVEKRIPSVSTVESDVLKEIIADFKKPKEEK
ncbi:hypothetical protein [Bacillus paramycoides]|uniref:hypothetical protein n=1 Tax=Bacillus paramycoides TaxID=2026194 RepID=UPI002E1B6F93|nr:hypothetical protein [Bacillus paramycoides]